MWVRYRSNKQLFSHQPQTPSIYVKQTGQQSGALFSAVTSQQGGSGSELARAFPQSKDIQ